MLYIRRVSDDLILWQGYSIVDAMLSLHHFSDLGIVLIVGDKRVLYNEAGCCAFMVHSDIKG